MHGKSPLLSTLLIEFDADVFALAPLEFSDTVILDFITRYHIYPIQQFTSCIIILTRVMLLNLLYIYLEFFFL